MKNRWVKNFGLSLLLSFGLFFLNGKTVCAEEEKWGPPKPQHEFTDYFNEDRPDYFFPFMHVHQQESFVSREGEPAAAEENSEAAENVWQPELTAENVILNEPEGSETIPADVTNAVSEPDPVTEQNTQTEIILQETDGPLEIAGPEVTAGKSENFESGAEETVSRKNQEESETEGETALKAENPEGPELSDLPVLEIADSRGIEDSVKMKSAGKLESVNFAPERNRHVITPAPAESAAPEEENTKPAWNRRENRFAYPGKVFPAVMGSSYGTLYRNTGTAFTGSWSDNQYDRPAAARQNRHIFRFETPAPLVKEQSSKLPASRTALTPASGSSPSGSLALARSELVSPAEFIISGTDIPVINGIYSFRLVLRSNKTLTFDNDLENTYQGIDGDYQLHYDINEEDNHTMIVDGLFANIITASPLLERLPEKIGEWVSDHISEDSYLYQLALVTKEGFTFENALKFLYDKTREAGLSVKYSYDLLTNKSSLVIDIDPIWSKLKLRLGLTA